MHIYNEIRQTLSQRDDIVIHSLNVRIRAKRFSGLKKAMYRNVIQDIVERAIKEETVW